MTRGRGSRLRRDGLRRAQRREHRRADGNYAARAMGADTRVGSNVRKAEYTLASTPRLTSVGAALALARAVLTETHTRKEK